MQDSLGPAAERECHPGDIVGERGRHSMGRYARQGRRNTAEQCVVPPLLLTVATYRPLPAPAQTLNLATD